MALKDLRPLLAAWLFFATLPAVGLDDSHLQQRGRVLVARHCARCHAIGVTGPSAHPEAPPFRRLGQRYPIASLAEALAEGLVTGHPDMPEFVFEVGDVGAILAYLQSIQESETQEPR